MGLEFGYKSTCEVEYTNKVYIEHMQQKGAIECLNLPQASDKENYIKSN